MKGQHVVVTGANRGIGLELCKGFAGEGARVTGLCRKTSPELDRLGVHVAQGIDLGSTEAPNAVAKALADAPPIDVFVHNAGILDRDTLADVDAAKVLRQFQVNAVAPLMLTQAIQGRLRDGAKLVFVTSRMGSIADNGSGSYYGYRMSKAALNMAARSLTHDLAPRGISVLIVHPGFVRTGMTGGAGDVDPQTSATDIRARIAELSSKTSGAFLHARGEHLPW
jgi:NAD(P)-dependent dehydrogenase (short-subunit alcohol dehydrogenase family)